MDGPLRLRGEDAEDMRVISACLQDAILRVGDIEFAPDERCFLALLNRFRWEAQEAGATPGPGQEGAAARPAERVHCLVRVENVAAVRGRGVDRRQGEHLLELLTIQAGPGVVNLVFSGGAALQLTGEDLCIFVEDVGEGWPAGARPKHP